MTSNLVDAQLGAFIRRYRLSAGLSSGDLAARLHKSELWVRDVEFGRIRLGSAVIADISEALDISISELFESVNRQPIPFPRLRMARVAS